MTAESCGKNELQGGPQKLVKDVSDRDHPRSPISRELLWCDAERSRACAAGQRAARSLSCPCCLTRFTFAACAACARRSTSCVPAMLALAAVATAAFLRPLPPPHQLALQRRATPCTRAWFSPATRRVSCIRASERAQAPLADLINDGGQEQRLIFVGGKGGVGKTTTSSALAVRLADSGLNTLIVSTDPAHSLSDALAQDVSGGVPVAVDGCATLQAMEVQTDEAIARFRAAVGGFRASDLGLGGVAEDVLSKLGLDEFADILDNVCACGRAIENPDLPEMHAGGLSNPGWPEMRAPSRVLTSPPLEPSRMGRRRPASTSFSRSPRRSRWSVAMRPTMGRCRRARRARRSAASALIASSSTLRPPGTRCGCSPSRSSSTTYSPSSSSCVRGSAARSRCSVGYSGASTPPPRWTAPSSGSSAGAAA